MKQQSCIWHLVLFRNGQFLRWSYVFEIRSRSLQMGTHIYVGMIRSKVEYTRMYAWPFGSALRISNTVCYVKFALCADIVTSRCVTVVRRSTISKSFARRTTSYLVLPDVIIAGNGIKKKNYWTPHLIKGAIILRSFSLRKAISVTVCKKILSESSLLFAWRFCCLELKKKTKKKAKAFEEWTHDL